MINAHFLTLCSACSYHIKQLHKKILKQLKIQLLQWCKYNILVRFSGCPRTYLDVIFNILLHYVAKMKNSILADLRGCVYWSFIFSQIAHKTTSHFFEGRVTFRPNRYKYR